MISLVVLSYNHRNYILETLDSIYSLNAEKEVIIIDDGSSDGSCSLIENYIANNNYQEITTFISKKNSGLVNSLNMALGLIKSEYAFFIASDDIVNPNGFLELYDKMVANKNIKAGMGNAYIYYEGQTPSKLVYNKEHSTFFNQSDASFRKEIFLNFPKPLLLQTVIFRTEILKKINGWDPQLVWDDYPLFVKLFDNISIENGEYLFLKDIIVSKYRQHDSNTYKNIPKQLLIIEETFKKIVPAKFYKDALANQYAFYFLICLRGKNKAMCQTIIKKAISEKVVTGFIKSLVIQTITWISRRFSR